MKVDPWFLLRLFAYVAAMTLAAAILTRTGLVWTKQMMGLGVTAVILAFGLSLIRPREILLILRDG